MSESLVDLLLVRLGREEERRKVLKLLITSLDLSVSDAENAVNNSPSVIREAVPMGEARVIQKELYPYIDLLPRFNDAGEAPLPADPVPEAPTESAIDEIEPEPENDDAHDEDIAHQPEPVFITTASEEILSTKRCHICGRTPTGGERLAPCRTCSDLTCRECFDRIAHVCNKCAASGKAVEHPNDGVAAEPQRGLEFDSDAEPVEEAEKGGNGLLRILIPVLVVLAAATAFYILDPMNMFGTEGGPAATQPHETPDSASSEMPPDTGLASAPDTLGTEPVQMDTLAAPPVNRSEDPLGLLQLRLPQGTEQGQPPTPLVSRTDIPASVRAAAPPGGPGPVPAHMAHIAAAAGVEIDHLTLLVYHDTTSVLVMSILHPAETETRLDLLRRTAQWLEPSRIDQLVLIYRENRYQTPVLISLVRDVFPDVQGVLSPAHFQSFFSYRENCWESVSGPVVEWLTGN